MKPSVAFLQIVDGDNMIFNSALNFDDVISEPRRFISSTRNGFIVRFVAEPGDSLTGFTGTYRQSSFRNKK